MNYYDNLDSILDFNTEYNTARQEAEKLFKEKKVCSICGNPFVDGHHLVPKELGGADEPHNIIYLCANHHRMVHFLLDMCSDDIKHLKKSVRKFNRDVQMVLWIQAHDVAMMHFFKNKVLPTLINHTKKQLANTNYRTESE